ncbi:MAG: MATE family efflux transporter [Caulobacteraceae bacterium]
MAGEANAQNLVRKELAELLKLAGPVILGRLGIMIMGLTDAIVVGRYSATQLGYHALGWAPSAVVMTVALGLLSGVQVMTSRAIGEGRLAETGAVLRRGLAYALQMGLAASAILLAGGSWFLHSIGLEKDLADGSSAVLMVFALSMPATTISVACSSWLEAHGRPGPATALMWAANAVNLAIDLVLVPGGFGIAPMGAIGGGWATFGARAFLAIATLAYILRLKEARAWGVFDKPPRDPPAEAEQRRVGYGSGASNFFEVASFSGMNIIAGWIGPIAVAGYSIVLNVASVVFMVPLGLATATAVLVGRAYGRRDDEGIRRAALIGFAVAGAFGVVINIVVALLPGPIAGLYTRDAAALALTVPALLFCSLLFAPDALQVVVAQALRARGDVWPPTFTHLASYILVMTPMAYVLAIPMHMGLMGLIWGINVSGVVSAGLLLGRFWMLSRKS